jgi:antitoxin StbD
MSALLSRADQAVSITEITRSAKQFFDRIVSGEQDKYVVMRQNSPAAVMLSVPDYEAMVDELEDLRIEHIAAERLAQPVEKADLISHEDMMARYL